MKILIVNEDVSQMQQTKSLLGKSKHGVSLSTGVSHAYEQFVNAQNSGAAFETVIINTRLSTIAPGAQTELTKELKDNWTRDDAGIFLLKKMHEFNQQNNQNDTHFVLMAGPYGRRLKKPELMQKAPSLENDIRNNRIMIVGEAPFTVANKVDDIAKKVASKAIVKPLPADTVIEQPGFVTAPIDQTINKKILVISGVDSSTDALVTQPLIKNGYNVTMRSTAKQGYDHLLVHQDDYNTVIVDMSFRLFSEDNDLLPSQDCERGYFAGVALYRRFKNHMRRGDLQELPVILISARADRDAETLANFPGLQNDLNARKLFLINLHDTQRDVIGTINTALQKPPMP